VTATLFYESPAEIAQLGNTFLNSLQAPADPTTVSCVVTDPSGTAVTHTYNGAAPADVTRSGTGVYSLAVPCSPAITGIDGLWSFVWVGTGAVSDIQPGTWRVLPVNVGTWYIGLEEFKDRLGITDNADDSQAQIAIQSVCDWVNQWTGTHFTRITETRTFVPHELVKLNIDPLVSVTALNVDRDGDGIFEEPWTQGTDYQLRIGPDSYNLNATGILRPYRQVYTVQSGKLFPFIYPFAHLDRVQITGTWGWSQVPASVTEAAFILAADLFKQKDAPFGVAGVSDYGVVKISANPWLIELLRPFKNQKRTVGV
jgi:hypothetical protein